MSVSLGRGISVYEMMRLIGRAKLAERGKSVEEITQLLRDLDGPALVAEYHRAVAFLLNKGLLSPRERQEVSEYARDWVNQQPMSL